MDNIWEGDRSCTQAPVQNICLFFSSIKINKEISNHFKHLLFNFFIRQACNLLIITITLEDDMPLFVSTLKIQLILRRGTLSLTY